MTKEEIKSALSSYRYFAQEVDILEKDLQEWEHRYKMNLSSECLLEMNKIMRNIQVAIERAGHERDRAKEMIQSLDNQTQRLLLERRYILGQSWRAIREIMHYSRAQALKIHGKAIDSIAKSDNP